MTRYPRTTETIPNTYPELVVVFVLLVLFVVLFVEDAAVQTPHDDVEVLQV